MKIYTKIGDQGSTRLGDGSKVDKNDLRITAYGELDELNATIGLLTAQSDDQDVTALLYNIQKKLFAMGSALANPKLSKHSLETPPEDVDARLRLAGEDVADIEKAIDERTAELAKLRSFILPGGSTNAAMHHVARTVCRRAERSLVQLHRQSPVPAVFLVYINRLSDLFFTLARYENQRKKIADIAW